MSWVPGRPVVTAQDNVEWTAWRSERKREQQRWRRARFPRIDYYPDNSSAALVYGLARPRAGMDLSSVINRIVAAWAALGAELPPE